MSDEQREARIEVSVLDGWTREPGVDIVVEQAWLPMVILDGVKVVVQGHQSISMMERFVLESLLRLQTLELREMQEIASIPPELGAWLLSGLQQKGLIHAAGAAFTPDLKRCAAALETGELPVERTEQRDLLWFPESDEGVVLERATGLLRALQKLNTSGRWPVPPGWQGKTRTALLDEPLKKKRFYGDGGSNILRILDENAVEDDHLPAYRCSATTSRSSRTSSWHVELCGVKRVKHDDDRQPEIIRVPLDVPLLPKLTATWSQRVLKARADVKRELQHSHFLSIQPDQALDFSASLREGEARAFALRGLVSEVHSLRIRIDDEFQCIVPLRCSPADDGAARIFAIDRTIRSLLSASRTDPEFNGVRRQDVLNRLWQLRLFKPLYDLREAEDFAA